MSAMEETIVTEILFASDADMPQTTDAEAYLVNENEVWEHNRDAMLVDVEALNAFLELLGCCDNQYIDTQVDSADYGVEPQRPALDWDHVAAALDESQRILVGVQQLLSEALREMGVEDYEHIRVYSDSAGFLHLLADHQYKTEIEAALNSDYHRPLRELYQAATAGMSMAGGLVGNFAVPEAVVKQVAEKRRAEAEAQEADVEKLAESAA